MVTLLRRHEYTDITFKLIMLYALNVMDILFTQFLVGTGFFMEANPLMALLMGNALVAVLFKIAFPAIVFVFLAERARHATFAQRRTTSRLINLLLIVYAAVALLHVAWVIVYFTTCV